MKLHEYQAKQLFRDYDIPTPSGFVFSEIADVNKNLNKLESKEWVVKAQVHAGGRGKAGGILLTKTDQELTQAVQKLIGTVLITHQTGDMGLPISKVLVEEPCAIARELYMSVIIDRSSKRIVFVTSEAGGMDIEEVAITDPQKIIKTEIDPIVGLQLYQCRKIAFSIGLNKDQLFDLTKIMVGLYNLFIENDASLVEINPLVITQNGVFLAADAKINLDDNALFRHPKSADLRDPTQEDENEHKAQQFGLNYIKLEGNIACMVNGAGLAMATMDIIKLEGGEPANFLDVGGNTDANKVAEAFKIILSDQSIKAILVNIFGGIVRCNLIADGIVQAVKEVHLGIPVVVRLEGTNAQQGRDILNSSGLAIIAETDLAQAARKVVLLANES